MAPRGNQNAKGNKGGKGGPQKYDANYARRAALGAEAGLTDVEIADMLAITEQTLYKWKKLHPEFDLALKMGKDAPDMRVEQSLYKRALGYKHEAVKIAV